MPPWEAAVAVKSPCTDPRGHNWRRLAFIDLNYRWGCFNCRLVLTQTDIQVITMSLDFALRQYEMPP